MAVVRRPRQSTSSDSSQASSSSDDDNIPSGKATAPPVAQRKELSLEDDENTLVHSAVMLDDEDEPGESDAERTTSKRTTRSAAVKITDNHRKPPSAARKRKRVYFICMSMCKYECVRRAAKRLNFREVADEEDWNIYWTDSGVGLERVSQMKKWQKINHFPGMSEICRKDALTRNMSRMVRMFPKEYAFYPRAWCLPADYNDFLKYCAEKKYRTYISKPDVGCQGRGIFITKNPSKDIKPTDNFVVQVYVNRPFLIDGYKFDLRVYVAVTSCDPFRIFVYKDGLARFTTQHYEEPSNSNCRDIFMHLTNYAIQKRSEDFIRDEDAGTKRRITTINRWLVEHGYDIVKLWADIDDVIIKVLLSAQSVLKHNYRSCFPNHYRGSACFEILGFDILIDRKLKPYVLEVNHSPSFTTDSKLDREIKDALIYDTLLLLNLPAADKRRFIEEDKKRVKDRLLNKINKKDNKYREEQEDLAQQWQKEVTVWEDEHIGNYRRIYPGRDTAEKYDQFLVQSGTLYSETAASKARIEQAKAQMVELQKKQDKINAYKSGKSTATPGTASGREVCGESPARKTLPRLFNRMALKRQTTTISSSSLQSQCQCDPTKPGDIDEGAELERVLSIKQRETLIRGMGVIDLCHRLLAGTPGTTSDVPLTTHANLPSNRPQPMAPQMNFIEPSHSFSLLQYVNSKNPLSFAQRDSSNASSSAQVIHKYFTSQQQLSQPKYETRLARHLHMFEDKPANTVPYQNGARSGRYQPAVRSTEMNSALINFNHRLHLQTHTMPHLTTNLLSRNPVPTDHSALESSIRAKSAKIVVRQRTGLVG